MVVLSPERSDSMRLSAIVEGHRRLPAPPEMQLFRFPDLEKWKRAKPKAVASLARLMKALGEPASEARPHSGVDARAALLAGDLRRE